MAAVSDYNNISKFLNRLLGVQVAVQNALFQYFTDTLAAICLQAKRNGRWDMGILGKSYTHTHNVHCRVIHASAGTIGMRLKLWQNTGKTQVDWRGY